MQPQPPRNTQHAGQCYCGETFNPAASNTHATNMSECAGMPCAGNSSQTCGNACRIIIFNADCSDGGGACHQTPGPPPPPPPKPLIPAALLSIMAGDSAKGILPAATGVIGGVGHALGDDGTFSIPASDPWLKAQVAAAHRSNLTFVPLIAGCTLVQLRALVFSPRNVDVFVAAFVADAMAHGYDGFNFDWEVGGFNSKCHVFQVVTGCHKDGFCGGGGGGLRGEGG